MVKTTNIVALWTVAIAVLFVLLSPLSPGVVAPHGGKLLKPYLGLALNTFINSLMIAAVAAWAALAVRAPQEELVSFHSHRLSLRC